MCQIWQLGADMGERGRPSRGWGCTVRAEGGARGRSKEAGARRTAMGIGAAKQNEAVMGEI